MLRRGSKRLVGYCGYVQFSLLHDSPASLNYAWQAHRGLAQASKSAVAGSGSFVDLSSIELAHL